MSNNDKDKDKEARCGTLGIGVTLDLSSARPPTLAESRGLRCQALAEVIEGLAEVLGGLSVIQNALEFSDDAISRPIAEAMNAASILAQSSALVRAPGGNKTLAWQTHNKARAAFEKKFQTLRAELINQRRKEG